MGATQADFLLDTPQIKRSKHQNPWSKRFKYTFWLVWDPKIGFNVDDGRYTTLKRQGYPCTKQLETRSKTCFEGVVAPNEAFTGGGKVGTSWFERVDRPDHDSKRTFRRLGPIPSPFLTRRSTGSGRQKDSTSP